MSNTSEMSDLKAAISALEAQRPILGDAVVEAALGPMREKLAALEESAAPEQQRKQVTVLFGDVVGFTALSETMDAELITGLMNQVWTALDAVILDHGGHIDKHIGDAVMALWGVDAAREDDPEQAIRAALAMQAALTAFCHTSGATPLALSMRIGIHTGPVLLGQVGSTQEFTAMGDTVNLASRLETAAEVGTVLISHATYAQVRGIFDVDPLEPLTVKGKTDPVEVYKVKQAKPRAFRLHTRGVEGVETRMIGRDAELMMMQQTYYDAAEEGETRLMLVVGEAGVGKSRLLYEFDNWLELLPTPVTYYKGRATANLQSVPYSLFRDLFAFRFDIRDSDTRAVAIEKFRAGFLSAGNIGTIPDEGQETTVADLTADQADLVGHWIGFDFSQSKAVGNLLGSSDFATVARAHLMRYLRHVTDADPVVILLEDIHWADDSSLDLITQLLQALPEARLLIVGVARPSLYERRPLWGGGESIRRIEMAPLSRRAGRALVDEILQRVDEVPAALRDTIVDAAEGNPFYIEELVKMFIEQGVIVRGVAEDADRWRVRADKLAAVNVPSTLTALLQARIDGLPQLERELLQRAAVVGRLFWDGVVAELAQTEQAAIQPVLEAMRGRELIFQREHSAFAGSDEFVFKHNLLRDVAYERVLLKWRQEFHGRVARWLEAHAGERLSEYLSLIAEHYEQAGENEKAAAYLLRAGQEALGANANAAARDAFERVVTLQASPDSDDSPLVVEALVGLGQAIIRWGDYEAARRALQRGRDGARALDDPRLHALALVNLSMLASSQGAYAEALTLAQDEALPLAQTVGGATLADAHLAVGGAQWQLGDLSAAQRQVELSLALAREAGDTTLEARGLTMRAILSGERGEFEEAARRFLELLQFSRDIGDVWSEVRTLLNLGDASYRVADYTAARSYGQAALQKAREMDARQGQVLIWGNLAQTHLKLGEPAAAQEALGEALRLAVELDTAPDKLFGVQVMAELLAAEGARERALALLAMVAGHPAAAFQFQQEIEGLRDAWEVSEVELAEAQAAAAELELEAVIAEILAESGGTSGQGR